MLLRFDWIGEYVELREDHDALADLLTRIGITVDAQEPWKETWLLELDIPANRPDLMSHFGVAREIAAATHRELKVPDLSFEEEGGPVEGTVPIEIEDPAICRRYSGRVILDAAVGSSPPWLEDRLESLGLRPVNQVVDVTNHVLWELGHPLHAFDLDTLKGERIVVRRARPGEKIITLDDVERELDPEDIVIADAERPVALAGVMGGLETEISERTSRILLESAHFEPSIIYRTARRHRLGTDASARFQRGADPEITLRALERVCHLLAKFGTGRVMQGSLDANPRPWEGRSVTLRWERAEALIGAELDPDELLDVLQRLGFGRRTESAGRHKVQIPSWRGDVEREIDLVEELARHHGMDRIPSELPSPDGGAPDVSPRRARRESLRDAFAAAGFLEVTTFPFIEREHDDRFRYRGEGERLPLANPLAENQGMMRGSLLPGLLTAVVRNQSRGEGEVRLFEVAKRFWRDAESGEPREAWTAACVLSRRSETPPHWSDPKASALGFYDLKGALEAIFEAVGFEPPVLAPSEHPVHHPAESSEVRLADRSLGPVGRLHPDLEMEFDLRAPTYAAEIDLEALLDLPEQLVQVRALSRYPWVERDLSLLLPEGTSYRKVAETAHALRQEELIRIRPLDRYVGSGVPKGKLSLTVRLRYQSLERTLTQEEVAARTEAVVESLTKVLGAELRS
jgi:phenylalanyl-tRNA synthetase beta chain